MNHSLLTIALILFVHLCGLARGSTITTKADISFHGQESRVAAGTLVKTSIADVYLTENTLAKKDEESTEKPPVEYVFNQEVVNNLQPGRPKIALVVRNSNQQGTDENGITKMSLTDPELGEVTFNLAITKVTPTLVHWTGIEYERTMSFPLHQYSTVAYPLILKTISDEEPATISRAALFFIQAGELERAEGLIEKIAHPKILQEISAILSERKQRQATASSFNAAQKGQISEAAQFIDGIEGSTPELDEQLQGIRNEAEKIEVSRKWLSTKDLHTSLPDRSLLRLHDLIEAGLEEAITSDNIEPLTERWAETIPTLTLEKQLTADQLGDAIGLARDMGAFLSNDGKDLPEISRKFSESSLPVPLRLEITKFAPPATKEQWSTKWEKVEFQDPVTGDDFHYYKSFPPGFDPSTPLPALFTLHGMNTKADVMRTYWGQTADAHGYIMISPEYIYGREHGFRYSNEEMRSILGAIEHASRTLPIDSSRILLQGHSQGGHTAWEAGCVMSQRLSGVIPMLGVTLRSDALINYGKTPLYLIDGDLDGAAPKMIRDSMQTLNRIGIDATYVEYRGRHHEAFYEEYPRVMKWARAYQRTRSNRLNFTAFRPSDLKHDWIEILETETELPMENAHNSTTAEVKAELSGTKLTIESKNVRRIAVHVPLEWRGLGELAIDAGRVRQKQPIIANWQTMLQEVYRTGDRHHLTMETRIVDLN